MIGADLQLLLRRRRVWLCWALLCALPALVAVLLAATGLAPPPGRGGAFLSAVVTNGQLFPAAALALVLPVFLPITVAIVAGDAVAGEASAGTLRYLLVRPVGRLRLLVGKPGLDGHSNGAEQIAVRARDAGFEVIYQGIRLTPAQIVAAAVAEDVHCIGLSILSGSHMELVPDVQKAMAESGIGDVPLIVGGIIPESDARKMEAAGVAAVFTPKDFGMTAIMDRIVDEIRKANDLS